MNPNKARIRRTVFRFIRDYIVPPICPACGERLSALRDAPFCADCHRRWEEEKRERCKDCGLSFFDCVCLPPLLKEFGIRDGIFLSAYRLGGTTATDRLIYSVKSERNRLSFEFLAREMSRPIRDLLRAERIRTEDVIVTPLPRRRRAVRENGFDQAALLAEELADSIGCELRVLLARHRDGREQKLLGREDRLSNLKRAFRLKGAPVLSGKTVLLIDDVMTTGSSLRVAAEPLYGCGVDRVVPVTVARTVDVK